MLNTLGNTITDIDQKDDFIGVIGHELRTPLSILKMGVEFLILKTVKSDPAVATELKELNEQIDRLAGIITNLLDLPYVASGGLQTPKEKVAIGVLVEEVIQFYRSIVVTHEITLEAPRDVEITANKEQIVQVLYNLLSNAIKYAPGKKKIDITVLLDIHSVKILVRDYGPGIPVQSRAQVFNRFYRLNGRREVISGLGVGLFISREIMKAHGGSLDIVDTDGEGTTFEVRLPH